MFRRRPSGFMIRDIGPGFHSDPRQNGAKRRNATLAQKRARPCGNWRKAEMRKLAGESLRVNGWGVPARVVWNWLAEPTYLARSYDPSVNCGSASSGAFGRCENYAEN